MTFFLRQDKIILKEGLSMTFFDELSRALSDKGKEAAQKAKEAGCSEAVFVRDGYVTEGSHSNISIIKDGVFITHPLDNLILPGTERKHMLAYCKELGIPTKERAFTLEELAEADEIIVSSTSHPSMRAMELDKKAVGMKNPELVEKLRKKYMDEIEAL